MIKWLIDNLKRPYYEKMISTQVTYFTSLIPIGECIGEGIRSKKIVDPKSLSSMVKQLVKKVTGSAPNIITNPLTPHQEGNVNAIITVEERVPDFSSPSFPWKAMLRALIEREIVQRDDCVAANLCPLANQSGTSCNAVSVGSRKDYDKYLPKRLGKVTSLPPSSVVIEEIIESPVDSESSNLGKGQALPVIEGFTLLVLTLLAIVGPASSSVQEGIASVPAVRGFDPLILPRPTLGIFGVSGSKALEAILPSPVVINPKTFSIALNLQTQEGVIIRMLKPFPCKDSDHVPWKYDVSLISTQTGKEEVCSNISSGLSRLTRNGRCYTLEELEKRRKKIGKRTVGPIRNRVTTKEVEEFLKIIKNSEYSVIQQLNRVSELESAWPSATLMALSMTSKIPKWVHRPVTITRILMM
ncbi:hypothetical protein SO802_028943 [Lithocarpus litseifolius]|uniref:Uncharacterized protein n=1 Tax=Lithocarpus litseifolius TaxID=425828 RepID=A0AAW2BRY5_9ROSI